VRLNAYVLAGDPAWIVESIGSYYDLVDRIVVSYDRSFRSWGGHPLSVEESLRRIAAVDPEGKTVLLPGDHSDPGFAVMANETVQRQQALDAASEGADWVLQFDTDEIVASPRSLLDQLAVADGRAADALVFPLRTIYARTRSGRFLEHCGRFWTPQAGFPGPVAVRSGTTLSLARQAEGAPVHRVDVAPRNTDPAHPFGTPVHAVIPPDEAVLHMSWVRTERQMAEKRVVSGYADERNWTRDLRRWRWRARHPWLTAAGAPVKRDPFQRFRVVALPQFAGAAVTAGVDLPVGQPVRSVDVVIPTNRVSPYLPAALASVVAQTYRNWRVIVVDDGSGSPDALERIVAEVPGAEVIHQENAGAAAARNTAIRAGGGDVIAFLDDDDVWPPERLEHLVRALDRRPDALGAFGDGVDIDGEGRVFGSWHSDEASSEEYLSGRTPIPRITTLVVRRAALEQSGLFDEAFGMSQDTEFTLRVIRRGALVSCGAVVVEYRRHDHNVTRADWRVRYAASSRAVRTNLADARAKRDAGQVALLQKNFQRLAAATASGSVGRVIGDLKAGRRRAARDDIRDSLRLSPTGFVRGAVTTLTSKVRSRFSSRRT
jgi:GT2 family glycosyltransferase